MINSNKSKAKKESNAFFKDSIPLNSGKDSFGLRANAIFRAYILATGLSEHLDLQVNSFFFLKHKCH